MAHNYGGMVESGKKGKGKITSIHIDFAENGYKYCVHKYNMNADEYVYTDSEDVIKALRGDMKVKKETGLKSEVKRNGNNKT